MSIFPQNRLVVLAAVAAIALAAPSARAGTFTVHNTGTRTVEACICYYIPGSSGMLADGTDLDPPSPPSWNLKGWWNVRPGQVVNIDSGAGDKVYVRLSLDDGTVLRPDRPRGEPLSFMVVKQRFDRPTTSPAGPGAYRADGFYPYPANDRFTVR